MVDGQSWPFVTVEPRQYRFRLLNASKIHIFRIFLVTDSHPSWRLAFAAVGIDSGLTSHPVYTNSVVVAVGERYDVVNDFSPYARRNLTMMGSEISDD